MKSPFKTLYLRLDVDHCTFNRFLSYFRLVTGLPIPFFLNNVWETKKFLLKFKIPRIWMFRPLTCPNKFDEPHGLHATNPEKFGKELEAVEAKLGKIKFFSRHGYARLASGRIWTKEEIRKVEKEYDVVDISDEPHITIERLKNSPFQVSLLGIRHILFHPCNLKRYGKQLEIVLRRVEDFVF